MGSRARRLLSLRDRGKVERGEIMVDYEDLYRRLPASTVEFLELARRLGPDGPRMAFGPFRQMYDGAICMVNQVAVTGTSEVGLWPAAQYTAFNQNQLRMGQAWTLSAYGIISTASSSQGNITLTPRFGTTTSGTSLDPSAATALAASATNAPWRLTYDFDVHTIGAAGANSKVQGNGEFKTTVAAIAASTGNVVVFGSTGEKSVDVSQAAGLFMGVTLGSASDSMTTMGVRLESIN